MPLSESGSEYYGDLYRLRTGPLTQLTQRDLFHIPFEKRQLVASQRYSIPGLPSLYLASSLWIAWEELGRPALASIHASRFEGKGNLRVLDFGWSPSLAGLSTFGHSDGAETFGEFAKGQAIIWPLIAACSLVRRHPGTFCTRVHHPSVPAPVGSEGEGSRRNPLLLYQTGCDG